MQTGSNDDGKNLITEPHMNKSVTLGVILLGGSLTLYAQVPFNTAPSWISTDISNYSTGAAWVDINKDGWPDLVVANGNDMARQRVAVYYNTGTGSLPLTPGWQSSDIEYHGHLSVGDVNSDGFPDVAVSVYIGPSGFNERGRVKLYLNHNGTLSPSPSWVSGDRFYSFSCALGDADGDGDLDLAVAGGESYYHHPEMNRIYYNHSGILDSLPGWMSGSMSYSYDVAWADFDNDGDLDLVFANENAPNCIYENRGDSIGTAPGWSSTDPSLYANSLFVGDVNNDGYSDLAISDNDQLGGSGHFKLYLNNNGTLSTTPFWSSTFSGYGSGITLADFDDDGDRDLVTGGWWEPCRIYVNENGTFTSTPQWTSSTSSVVEAIAFTDFDNDRLDTTTVQFMGDGSRKLYYLPRTPVQQIQNVLFGSDTVSLNEYCFDLENGWISFAVAPLVGVTISINAVFSRDLDFVISNWDPSKGNYVFVNTSGPVSVEEEGQVAAKYILRQNYPNPFNPSTRIEFQVASSGFVELKVFDVIGREVAALVAEPMAPGKYERTFDARELTSGVYFYRLRAGEFIRTRRLLLLR
jgi:hypothetical protein